MPSSRTLRACSGGKRAAEPIAVTTPTSGRGRQQPAGSGPVEAAQLHGAGGAHLAPEQPGDQKARDDEEHVHADEPTTHTGQASVKEDNGHHRDSAQALDVRAKSRLYRALTLQFFGRANAVGLGQGHLT